MIKRILLLLLIPAICFGGVVEQMNAVLATHGTAYPDITLWVNGEGVWSTPTYTLGASEYTVGDNTCTAISAADINTDAVKIGTYGFDFPTAEDYFTIDVSGGDIINSTSGRIGRYYYIVTYNDYSILMEYYIDADNYFYIRSGGSEELVFVWKDGGTARTNIGTSTTNLATEQWYYVEAAWDTATNQRAIYVNGVEKLNSTVNEINSFASETGYYYMGNPSLNGEDGYGDQFINSNDKTRDLNALKDLTAKP